MTGLQRPTIALCYCMQFLKTGRCLLFSSYSICLYVPEHVVLYEDNSCLLLVSRETDLRRPLLPSFQKIFLSSPHGSLVFHCLFAMLCWFFPGIWYAIPHLILPLVPTLSRSLLLPFPPSPFIVTLYSSLLRVVCPRCPPTLLFVFKGHHIFILNFFVHFLLIHR